MMPYIKVLRPNQWTKNVFVLAGLFFSKEYLNPETGVESTLLALAGFMIFSIVSGVVYIVNDIADREADRNHPEKNKRPIASGKLKVSNAIALGIVLFTGSIIAAYFINPMFFVITLIYFIVNIFYSFYLKHLVLFDIISVALGFILRAIAGTTIIGVYASSWFLLCTFFLALLLASSKRRHEYITLISLENKTRRVLQNYSEDLLNQIIAIASSGAVISYSLYSIQPHPHLNGAEIFNYSIVNNQSQPEFSQMYFPMTIAFVIFGILRYLYIVYKKGEGANPEKILFKDRGILITVFLFGVSMVALALLSSNSV